MFNCIGCVGEMNTCPPFLSASTFLQWINSSSLCACVGDTIIPSETEMVDYCATAFSSGAPECCPVMFVQRENGSICMNFGECDENWVCFGGEESGCVGVATGTNPANFITEAFGGVCPDTCNVIHVVDGNGDVWITSNPNNNCTGLSWCLVCGGGGGCEMVVPVGTATNNFLAFFNPRPSFIECPVLKVCYSSTYPHLVHCWELVNDGVTDVWVNTTNGRQSTIEVRTPAVVTVLDGSGFNFINFLSVPINDLQAFNGTSFTVQDAGDYIISCFGSLTDPSPLATERTMAIFVNGTPLGGNTGTQTSSALSCVHAYAVVQRLSAGDVVQLGFRSTGADTTLTEIRLAIQMLRKIA